MHIIKWISISRKKMHILKKWISISRKKCTVDLLLYILRAHNFCSSTTLLSKCCDYSITLSAVKKSKKCKFEKNTPWFCRKILSIALFFLFLALLLQLVLAFFKRLLWYILYLTYIIVDLAALSVDIFE